MGRDEQREGAQRQREGGGREIDKGGGSEEMRECQGVRTSHPTNSAPGEGPLSGRRLFACFESRAVLESYQPLSIILQVRKIRAGINA